MFTSGNANAADPDKALYEAALQAIPSGAYYITTEVDGVKYYVTASGALEERTEFLETEDGLFTINQVDGGGYATIGWHINGANGHFSNTTLTDNKANLHPGTHVFRLDTGNNRNDWESQVFFLNEEGKVAIRSCNTGYGESSWADAGRAFWTYEVDEAGDPVYTDYGLDPCYSYEPAFIWTLEQPTGFAQVKLVFDGIYSKYENLIWEDDPDNPFNINMGTEFGQYAGYETWYKLWEFLQEVNAWCDKFVEPDYDYYTDADAPSLEDANRYAATADSLYLAVLESEVQYTLPEGDGYYRIVAHNRYASTSDESGFVDKALAASFEDAHKDKAVYGTLIRDKAKARANYLWKLTQKGDSILMQNAGLGTYVSFSSPAQGRIIMTEDVNDASCVQFDYAYDGPQYVEPDGEGDDRDIFSIRLASETRQQAWPADNEGNISYNHQASYFHQNNHSSKTDDTSPWGNYGVDTNQDQEVSFWIRTWDANRTTDLNTSEWYLEYVPEDEAAEIIKNFEAIFNHDVLVAQNNALREKVAETLALAKDVIVTKMITKADQLSSPNSDEAEGTNIGNLIDGDAETFWHTSWHNSHQYPRMNYSDGENEVECHYLQISGMKDFAGDCQMYFRERAGADNDRPTKVVLMGTDELPEIPEGEEDSYVDYGDDWTEMAVLTLPHTGKGEENTLDFVVRQGFNYVRVLVPEVNSGFRTFWHAAEIQFYTVAENPNSQFNQMGAVAQTLERTYNSNCATADEDITLEIYEALLKAYNDFLASGLVDPAEMRAALATYAKATEGVVEGKNPGYWSDMKVVNDYNKLYAEVDAYNKAGKYDASQIHKYAVMLKAMQKSVAEQANGVKTDNWYRIMFPTEEMYDAYEFGKDGGDNCNELTPEDQKTMWGTFVSAGKLESEEVQDVDEYGDPLYDEEGNEVMKTIQWLEAIGGEDLREGNRLFFENDEEIEDKDASMFRFVELESDADDYTPLFRDVKENMEMALDMSVTYTKGEALITNVSQLSSNASDEAEGKDLGALIDGNPSTFWHSDWHQKVIAPPYLQVALNEPVSGMIEVDVVRRNNTFGHIVSMYIQGSNDAETWTNIGYMNIPYGGTPGEEAHSQAIELGGTYSYLRFINTRRAELDFDFDPFAEVPSKDKYNVADPEGYTYFHSAEFQIYPVTADNALNTSGKALQAAYTTANKVVLKDATAADLTAAAKAYKTFKDEINRKEGKAVLPNGLDKAPATYALQNKATGLYVWVSGTGNQNNILLKTVPTLVGYKAIGYERSLLSAKTVAGESCNNLHAGESNRRFCTWGSTEPTSNSGLIICEADEAYKAPAEFTYTKDIRLGQIYGLVNSVSITPKDAPDLAYAYTPLGQYTVENEGIFLALKEINTIAAGEPAFYIYGDTMSYNVNEGDDPEYAPVKFTFAGNAVPVTEGKMVNGVLGSLVNHTLAAHEVYFSGNRAICINATGYYISGPCAVLDLDTCCPQVDPNGNYDFSIFIGELPQDAVDGVKNIETAIEKISQPGNVYSMDGKLLRTGATLNSLKALGSGMYILNGVKVIVK